jgi:divalent metal cation (Fe/Co/Zn/Cd) transporter
MADDLETIVAAVRATGVKTVGAVRVATQPGGRLLVAVRIGLPPATPLSEIATAIAHVQVAVSRALRAPADVAVEPAVASDEATPTEAIVIRALE